MNLKFNTLKSIFAASVIAIAASASAQQTWPAEHVELIVPYPAGGSTDILARAFATALGQRLNVPIVVENKGGAGGTIGSAYVARSKPDGSVMLFTASSPLTIAPHLVKLNFEPLKNLQPVASVAFGASALVAGASSPFNNFKEFVEYVRAHPGKVSVGYPGIGSSGHLGLVMMAKALKLDLNEIPYQGNNQITMDAIAGTIDVISVNTDAVIPQVQSGKLKPIVVTSSERIPAWPSVSTLADEGHPDLTSFSNWGLYLPGGVSPEILNRLIAASRSAMEDQAFRGTLKKYDAIPGTAFGSDFSMQLKSYSDKYKAVIEQAHISTN
ncbi:Bug family tripartite tricarboxylate transporter substrate binding protein [Achromobacter aloeverae]